MAYAKHTWQTGETITATKLNNIENGIATNDEAIGDVPEQIDAIQEELEMKANIDGAYESMTVGNAEQLVSTQFVEDNAPYVFRTSGGSADIGNREEDTIVGGTVAWNQLANLTAPLTNTFTESASYSGYLGNLAKVVNATKDHVYFVAVNVERTIATNDKLSMIFGGSSAGIFVTYENGEANGVKSSLKKASATSSTDSCIYSNYSGKNGFEAGDSITLKQVQLFDLTQMFGTEVADAVYAMEQANAGSGIAWFKAMYPLDYYEYNTGELKSVEGLASHDMVGFNQWDEEWEAGDIRNATGENASGTGRIRCKNYIPVIGGQSYCFYCKEGNKLCLYAYDSDKNFIGIWHSGSFNVGDDGAADIGQSTVITLPSNCRYIKIKCVASYGANYNNDICINLHWSGTRDGEYEPYEKRSYALDSTLTLRGIPKVDADGQMYYDGDTYEADGTVTRKYGVMDLGVRSWGYNTSGGYFYTDISEKKNGNYNLICAKYVTTTSDSASGMPDKQIKGNATNNSIYIKDSAYTDAATFKTAMSGVYLVYELATPTTEQAEPFTTPQVVEDWGTEEYVTTGIVAVGHNTKYPQNLRDKLQHLPVLAEDDGAYLIQQTGTQMHLVNFRIPKAENLADGTYVLKATVSGGTPTYTWEAE